MRTTGREGPLFSSRYSSLSSSSSHIARGSHDLVLFSQRAISFTRLSEPPSSPFWHQDGVALMEPVVVIVVVVYENLLHLNRVGGLKIRVSHDSSRNLLQSGSKVPGDLSYARYASALKQPNGERGSLSGNRSGLCVPIVADTLGIITNH